jgi:Ca2+-dependent lipid-binding protein
VFTRFSQASQQYGDNVVGPLNIKIIEAILTRDTEMVGKMDPYVELTIGGVLVHKTATLDGAGKTPKWNEECDFEVTDMSAEVHFKILDEDVGSDDIVGEGTCTLADLCNEDGTDEFYDI